VSRVKLTVVVVGVLAVVGVGWYAADRVYLSPAAEKKEELASLRGDVDALSEALIRGERVKERWGVITSRMLASSDQEVEHLVRTLVSRAAVEAGLKEVVLSHGEPRGETNPATDRRSKLSKRLRDAIEEGPGFRVLRGTVRGSGSIEEVVRALAVLEAQPWMHRIESVRVEPSGRDRNVLDLTVAFATMFAPGAKVESPGVEEPLAEPSAERLASLMKMVGSNPFVAPPPPPPEPEPTRVVQKPVAPPAPPPPPYDRWRVAGVVETAGGAAEGAGPRVEVLMVRSDTGESRVLTPGQGVLGFTLESADGESAVFAGLGSRWTVGVGQTLAARAPAG
jgi:hypothetical protein